MSDTPVCCYCDAPLSCSHCGREQPSDDISDLRAQLAEHESNQRAYEEIIGKKTYREVADQIASAKKALQFIADGYENHDINHVDYRVTVYQVATDALKDLP